MASRPALPALTGLRFIAAALVVGYHVHAMIPSLREAPLLSFLGAGYSGVSLFFVLSGFVLTYNYLEPDGTGIASLRDFLTARFARIYPLYLLGVAIGFPIFLRDLQRASGNSLVIDDGIPITASVLTLLQAWIPPYACRLNCPGWSLSAEAFFYALFPVAGALLCRKKSWALFVIGAACWMVACGVAIAYVVGDPDGLGRATAASDATLINALKFNPLVRFPEFLLGIAAGLWFLRNPRSLTSVAAPLSIMTLAAIVAVFSLHERLPYPLMHNGLLAPLFTLLILALATGAGPIARLLSVAPMRLLGEASFALYLLHVAILVYVIKGLDLVGLSMERTPALLVVYLVVVQSLSIIVLQRIEEPARRAIRRRFATPS